MTLIIGIALIPVFYGLYVNSTTRNIRCHVPSWEGANKFYELVPYFFVLFLVLFMGSFAMRVVSDDTHISDSLLGSIMTFVAGIFAFALIYRTYGLEETTGYFTPVMAAEDRVVSLQIVDNHGHSLWAGQLSTLDDLYVSQPPAARPQAARQRGSRAQRRSACSASS
jgi:succinate dehydrogenase hydrophobic anchor subunit